jgi:hypothetical protein
VCSSDLAKVQTASDAASAAASAIQLYATGDTEAK